MGNAVRNTLAIVCGGGPAPGINSVISSVTIEAINSGWEVYGVYDGFLHLGQGEKKVTPLAIDQVTRIHSDGGSILRTSRFNPTKSDETMKNVVDTLIGIGKSAGATLTLIPEELASEKRIRMSLLVDIITGSIIKRLASGRNYGVAVIAEGLIEKIKSEDLEEADCVLYDDHGHIRYAEINFSEVLKRETLANLSSLGIDMTINHKDVGYEIRCAPPNAFDIEYTRNLGFAAMEFLRNGGTNAMITIQNDRIVPVPFRDIIDPLTGKTRIRMVNTESIQYRIAREYMIRLEKRDFEPGIEFEKLAVAAKLSPEEFRRRFEYVTWY